MLLHSNRDGCGGNRTVVFVRGTGQANDIWMATRTPSGHFHQLHDAALHEERAFSSSVAGQRLVAGCNMDSQVERPQFREDSKCRAAARDSKFAGWDLGSAPSGAAAAA